MDLIKAIYVGSLLFLVTVLIALAVVYVLARKKEMSVREYLYEFNRATEEHNEEALDEVIAQRRRSFAAMDDDSFRKYVQGVLNQTAFRLVMNPGHPIIHMRAVHTGSGELFPVWCKKTDEEVPAEHIETFQRAIEEEGCKGGLFITPTSFSQEAQELLKRWEHIKAIDGDGLMDIFKKSVLA